MSAARIGLAALAVLVLFLVWRWLGRRLATPASPSPGPSVGALLVESTLLTLLAGLWFGSLGSGGAVLLFALVGAIREVPGRWQQQGIGALPWKAMLAGIGRIALAGWLLQLILR